ncbi:MAG TPA: MarR family transcriptional regulator [Micromonosporaceae bacterium]|nr:MarR family transcriptional regulator [Micromonosporaceae bacterium]
MVKRSGQLPARPAGTPADERHETANALHSAALRLLRRARTADTGMDLDGPRASLLSVLVFAGPQPVTRLAAIEQVTPPAITKLVTALEAAGLVERSRSAQDRRVVTVSATAAGRRLLERGRAARVRSVARLLDGVPLEELAVLRRAAGIIADRLAAG